MKLLDLYFKAFHMFRSQTKDDENSVKLRNAIVHANHPNQVFSTLKYVCTIDEDWVKNIEEGLVYVEKAIREDRQFIRTEGEVVQIEKVKKVSKASIEHLSKHSNYITRVPKDNPNDVIPDKLYIVEKLSDYLVYENRFLFLLLSYVKDFVEMRLDKIREKASTYQSFLNIDKDIEEKTRNIKFKLEYEDVYKNDQFLLEQLQKDPMMKRAETVYAIAVSLLATPLMKEVSKAPMIKPPVIKTNVLRMNPNFKAALTLYDYITSYHTDGYEITEELIKNQPLTPELDDEIAETIELTSVIGYVEGNQIRSLLQARLDAFEEARLKEIETEKKNEIKRMKKRIVEMNEDPLLYMVSLEKRNQELERRSLKLDEEKEKNKELLSKMNDLRFEQAELLKQLDISKNEYLSKIDEIEDLKQQYFNTIKEVDRVHLEEMEDLEVKHQASLDEIRQLHQTEQYEQEYLFAKEKEELHKLHQTEQDNLLKKYQLAQDLSRANIDKLELKIEDLKAEKTNLETKAEELKKESLMYLEERDFKQGQYIALKAQQGLLTSEDDFTTKEAFKQLELERKAYNKLFKEEWKKAKKKIKEQARKSSFEKVKKKND